MYVISGPMYTTTTATSTNTSPSTATSISISISVTTNSSTPLSFIIRFSPVTKSDLIKAVDICLTLSPEGACSDGEYGPISEWDVSRVTDMSRIFQSMYSFNQDISKWDVSRVTEMNRMFYLAKSFNQDISKWDVSRVTDMIMMFADAESFDQSLCDKTWITAWHSPWDVVKKSPSGDKSDMFRGSNGSISECGLCSIRIVLMLFVFLT